MIATQCLPTRCSLAVGPRRPARRQRAVVVRAEAQQPEGEAPAPADPKPQPKTAYIDELPEIKRTEISPEMRQKLLREQYSLGGAPNVKMGTNWFLNISLFIAFLAVLSYLTGAL